MNGTIDSVDLEHGVVSIDGKTYSIRAGLIVLGQGHATYGTWILAPGQTVAFNIASGKQGGPPAVTTLWLLNGGPVTGSP
ncbi:MAG: hypothetical protein ACYC9J_14140 [Sulfuricaulis sp.]